MKLKSLIILLLLVSLSACGDSSINNSNSSSTGPSVSEEPSTSMEPSTEPSVEPSEPSGSITISESEAVIRKDIIFSEYVEGTGNNQAIEIYNLTENDVQMDNYEINIYRKVQDEPTQTIKLSGTLSAKDTYVIAYEGASVELKNKADLLSTDLTFRGAQPITLSYNGQVVDVLGNLGFILDYAVDVTLVRKTEFLETRDSYNEYDYIRYLADDYSHLGNVETTITEEELLAGPQLNYDDFSLPFFSDETLSYGGGGVVEVTVNSYGDGDTTVFNFPRNISNLPSSSKVRYQNINTPESMSNKTDAWGVPAKNFTNEQLRNANKIYVQSVKGYAARETFDRLLGWVWVGETLLNFLVVVNGYSNVHYEPVNTMFYKGVTFTNILKNAEIYARQHKLKIHGEKDPTWNYETNKPL